MGYTVFSRPARGGRAASAAVFAVAVCAAAACGTGVDDAAVDAARSSANAALSASAAATSSSVAARTIPTAEELDTQIKRALDPALPDSERTALIEDGEAFREAIPDMYRALQDHPRAVYGVTDPVFDNHDGTLTATLRLDKDGTGTAVRTTVVHFVHLDGRWKLSRTDLCGILRSADYRTAACG
ncbi:hypothetical protein [Nocardia donostiensis]|uniref:Low molecular weight antigen MTB12-like C-terminal domain-containing protein n=1 Tax=Nocardia donostiensis TaxID=1538463 RepID=A0A1V2TEI0_9NOCA|nr:hypothetical protein [Nocardia donostiensis]ONM47917.1 hypothetical protein B0T46_14840 [Nocardia donostiensis]OQS16373.1 hypothetical protein B0T36_06390 [Nocardia donostiensis]OQS21460.1 hypothetical protein B0T44_07445 [Nocardia donostiensis]